MKTSTKVIANNDNHKGMQTMTITKTCNKNSNSRPMACKSVSLKLTMAACNDAPRQMQ